LNSGDIRILCLDLALANTGVAVLSVGKHDRLLHVDVIRTKAGSKKTRVAVDEWSRCAGLSESLESLVRTWSPAHVFIECPTGGSKSAKAAKSMALSRGTACGTFACLGTPCTLVTPFEAKKAATGDPNASKEDVKKAAVEMFPDFDGWIRGRGNKIVKGVNEHAYDAVSVYMAATNTKTYKELKK
jgi:Holliday junction resolvasome RuvABC endonuclease subunit